jgi:hypothetical protein
MAKCPDHWLENIPLPENKNNFDPEWKKENLVRADFLDEMLSMMDKHGAEYFKNLNIWHVKPLRDRYIKETGVSP